jgi:hypothetical protein
LQQIEEQHRRWHHHGGPRQSAPESPRATP